MLNHRPPPPRRRAGPAAPAAALFCALAIAGCGGGGGDSLTVVGGTPATPSTPATPLPAPGASATTIDGVAAVGAALVGAQVRARCLNGDVDALAPTDALGAYTVELRSVLPPCLLQARGGRAGGTAFDGVLHSVALATGPAALHPLTELALAKAYGRAPSAVFDGFVAARDLPAAAALAAAADWVRTQSAAIGLALPAGELFATGFVVGDDTDRQLDALAARLAADGATLADLRGAAATAGSLAATLDATRAAAAARAAAEAQAAAEAAAAQAAEVAADTVGGVAWALVGPGADPQAGGVSGPLAGATVGLRCAGGAPQTGVVTGADGRFSLRLQRATVPCLLQLRGGTVGGVAIGEPVHGWITQGGGLVQATPLVSLVLARAWGEAPAGVFARYAGGADALGATALDTARQAVVAQLATLGVPAPAGDTLAGTLAAGDATAQALQALADTLAGHDVPFADLAAAAAARSDLAARVTADRSVAVQFSAVAGVAAVRCGAGLGPLGRTGTAARLMDLRFHVSEAVLLRADGAELPLRLAADSVWQHTAANGDAVTLIDLEDGSAECAAEGTPGGNTLLAGTVPAGRYVGLRFTLGVPHSLNHTDTATAPPPLDSFALGWSWQAGRKFAKIEVTQPSPGAWASDTFFVHLGSTGCTGNAGLGTVQCAKPNRGQVRLEAFDPRTQKIAVDVQALLADTDVTVNQGGAQGCMSAGTDRDCDGVFRALGIDWRADGSGSGLPIDGGRTQTVFRAVAK